MRWWAECAQAFWGNRSHVRPGPPLINPGYRLPQGTLLPAGFALKRSVWISGFYINLYLFVPQAKHKLKRENLIGQIYNVLKAGEAAPGRDVTTE